MSDYYKYSFELPKFEGTKGSSNAKIKNLASLTSFPVISTNINIFNLSNFVSFRKDDILQKARPRVETFRTRNKFIMARNVLSKYFSKNQHSVSQAVSETWKKSSKQFKQYFEYLAILESAWYAVSKETSSANIPILEGCSYEMMCSSKYNIRKIVGKKRKKTYTFKAKFRVSKSVRRAVNRRPPMDGGLQNRKLTYNCFGIVTEDIFKEL